MQATTLDAGYPLLVAGLVVFALQAAIIAALAVERRRRRRAEAQNRAMLSSMAADLAIVTHTGLVETCNENWSRSTETANPFTSARLGEPWVRPSQQLSAENQADALRVRQALDDVLAGREAERIIEYAWHAAADLKWSHLRLRRLDRPDGGVVVSHVDITARKRLEAEAQNTLHELAHLNMRAGMGELVSAVTHEVNQPLTASLSNAHALKRMIAADRLVYEDLSPILDDIIEANRRAAEVIGRIRALMRKEDFDMRPLDLNNIVTEIVRLMHPTAANEGTLLVADLDPDVPAIFGDRVQLRQVAMNLVLNAVQATRAHGSALPIVRVATAVRNGRASLIVEDAGAGVGDEALPRLFEPYFTTKEEGLGVGLSITRSIVESHGGSIEVANIPQGGARFSVILPRP